MEISNIHKYPVLIKEGLSDIEIKPLDFLFPSASLRSFLHRILLRYFRFRGRLEMIAEFDKTPGEKVPFLFNIIRKAPKTLRVCRYAE